MAAEAHPGPGPTRSPLGGPSAPQRWLRFPRPPPILLLALLVLGAAGHKLNVPHVLLPFSQEPGRVPFVLEAERGCYIWRSTHHDVVTVQPLYPNGTACSPRATLFAESTRPTRLSSSILARDVVTDHELRCDVKVDVIAGIEIVSRTRELYVDDAPLELAVRALDAEGNTFSSLAGMAFDWSLARDDESESVELSSRIRVLRYSEAEYSPPDYIAQMETAEKQGDRILVSGISTGAAVLKVRVHEPFYKNLAAASIRLLVLENVFLIPAHDVFLLVGASIHYRVARVVQGKMTEVAFPLEHYELVLQNHIAMPSGGGDGPVARLDERSATVTAVQLGRANLVFIHKSVHMRAVSGLPNCSLHVVEAGFLGFTVHPGDRWSLEVGQTYVVTVEVYDKSSMKVYMSDNLRVAHRFPEVFFNELMSTANGSFHVVRALRDGITLITASLTAIESPGGASRVFAVPISHEQEVKIYLPIKLSPAFLAFPHHPATVAYRYRVQVEGGSGNFTWTSSNETVATVTVKGIVVAGPVQGNSSVQARDIQNPFRYGEIGVLVLPLSKLELQPFHADVAVGHAIDIPVAMFHTDRATRESLAFTDCSLLALDVSTDKRGVFTVLREGAPKPGPTACSSAQITAEALGHTLVTVSVHLHQDHFEGSATFAAYEPLKAVNPVALALVAWHSSKEVVFEGGPGPWVLEPSRFFLELSAERPEWIGVVPGGRAARRKQNQYTYWVHCLQLGEQMLMFRVGNHPGVLNPHPAVETVQVVFVCAHPASLAVSPVYRVPAGARPCPLPQHNKQLVPVSSLRDTVLELTALDRHRRKFDNFSSLLVDWGSSNRTLAHFEPDEPMAVVAKGDGSGQTRLHGHRVLRTHRLKGTLFVRVGLHGYREDDGTYSVADLPASVTVELLLVEDVTVVPENATIYNHPDVKETFALVEGSGYFLVTSREQEVVAVTYREPDSFIQVVPIQSGLVTLEVYDLCLAFLGPARVQLSVVNVHELEVDVIGKVEVGKSVPVRVRVLGRPKQPFQKKYFRHMELGLQLASAIVTLTPMEEEDEWTETHLLRALTVGQTTLVAVARDKAGRKLTSAPHQIEVFPPFRLIPEKITLIPTNMVQVMCEGGPQPQSLIDFTVSNKTVALVNRGGQVTAQAVGTAVIHGTIQTVNEDTGLVTVFSQDEVEVEVVQLRAIRILAATTRLVTDTEMPVYVMGLGSAQTPFSFGNANPGLTFHWAVSKRDVLDLEPRQAEAGLEPPAQVSFAAVVRTRAAGRTNIRVTVRCPSATASASTPACAAATSQLDGGLLQFSDEVQILVFEKLQLLCPECPTERVLMSMNSQFQLHTNREGAAVVSSRVLKCFPNSSVIEEDGRGLLRAGAVAGSAVLEVTSREPFGVNQTAITGVQVAPVTYLWISTSPGLFTAPGKRLAAFPLGAALTFTVHLYDGLGERFHTHSAQLRLALNRDDLLLIGPGNKNHTYVAQAVNRGVTLLAVWDPRHPGLADYVPVPVERAIEPDARLSVVGDVVCFGTHLVGRGGEPGLWVVSPDNILQLDTLTGAAVARGHGTATVFYEIPGLVRTYQEVVVNASSRLTLSYDPRTFLTNAPDSGDFRLLIGTSRRGSNLRGSCSPLQEAAIKALLLPQTLVLCHVQFSNTLMDIPASQVFHVRANFSVRRGLYECLVGTRPRAEELLQPLSVADTAVYTWVSLSGPRGPGGSQRLLVPFVPAFFVNRSELRLSRAHPAAEVRVLGVDRVLDKLEVSASSPVVVVQRRGRSATVPGQAVYTVRVVNVTSLRQMAAPVFVNVSCPLTRQRAAVPVRAVREEATVGHCEDAGMVQQLVGSYQILLFTLFAVLASTAVIFLTYNAFLNRVQTVPVVYVPTPASGQTGYPYPSGGPYMSPQPPLAQSRLQHWLWSVRR
ncbi:nuclear pore membrane glycoprotein 210-like [Tachyglossus aculeatus]|uniref:nuclear pore membrane glycoprotein 210-like n=1 Tax=Tachyglossus aculeatus TaxID=9261 RepID=UPI0018F4D767|nr:nuclear pore membrane glycoprotein 210-like [Tachyglossus aculeatus]